MMTLTRWTTLCLFLLASLAGWAEAWTPETLQMVHLQDARRYVCNPDGVLQQAFVDSTDARLYALERDKGVETVVVVVEHLKGDDPYQFGMELARKYGIGKMKQNTGLIIILATGDRSYQILTGRGLEGTLPDAICRRIQNRVMVPLLKEEKWDEAIFETVKSIDGYVREDESIKNSLDDQREGSWSIGVTLLLVIIVFVVFMLSFDRKFKKCDKCGKRKWIITHKRRFKTPDKKFRIRTTWRCKNCGHEEYTESDDPNSGGINSGSSIPPIIFGGGSGRSGGSGFGGGSFGGGSFGGGGSGGRF